MIHFRASPEMICAIDALAAADRRTRSQWIKLTLEKALAAGTYLQTEDTQAAHVAEPGSNSGQVETSHGRPASVQRLQKGDDRMGAASGRGAFAARLRGRALLHDLGG
jgi:hypothetical protein